MGKPMRIDDLARRMIRLSGLTVRDEANPDGDIEISYTGLRPAEKLFEELLIGNNVSGTGHPMIMRAMEHSLPWSVVHHALTETMVALKQCDVRSARDLLIEVVHEYKPTGAITDLVWNVRQEAAPAEPEVAASPSPKVTSLQSRRGSTAH
jgi:FlaA1/EpsC-like NDP-sugar epimerase